jgi:serine/threonine protein kinase
MAGFHHPALQLDRLLDDAGPPAPAPALPDRIGRYRVTRLVAAGGMGVVYEARQDNPDRVVALKVMKHGIASRASSHRFEYEARILGRLRHPGIAQVYEASTYDDGSGSVPYFAMEFVPDARSLIAFAADARLSTRQRLELFAEVCDAVHHGHQKGVIHRDLKPDNILVDEAGHAKVIDFGIARATDSDIAVTTLRTDVGELKGTLRYMSPEQCEADPVELDIRSDVYSLGVVLYELLCGQLPYDLTRTSIPSGIRIIQEQQPARPSTVRRALRGNVEAIVLKALEKDRDRRYQSAADLARDIHHHLRGEPIDARPPTAWTRVARWIGRHPIAATAATCVLIASATLSATALAVWYLNLRPDRMQLSDHGREATLFSVNGRVLHQWRSDVRRGITLAAFLDDPTAGGRALAVIGYSMYDNSPWSGQLCAHAASDPDAEPIWRDRVGGDDLIEYFRAHDYNGTGFSVNEASFVADVLPDAPGKEIVAAFTHGPRSAAVLRVYNHRGEVLYEIWHDGTISSMCWQPAAGQLVMLARNSEVPWSARGVAVVREAHPIVVFAVTPTPGHVGDRPVSPSPVGSLATVTYYKCLRPAAAIDQLSGARIVESHGDDPPDAVRISIDVGKPAIGSASFLVDRNGALVPGSWFPDDDYRRLLEQDAAPDPAVFRLENLPPVLGTPSAPPSSSALRPGVAAPDVPPRFRSTQSPRLHKGCSSDERLAISD